jgi:hypothetical protein
MTADPELEIIRRIYCELAEMDEGGRRRALRYLSDRLLPTTDRGVAGGFARAAKLSSDERSVIATKAAIARWAKQDAR